MKNSWCGCSLQKGTKIISITHLLVNLATGIYRSYQLAQIDFAGEYDGVKAFSCISNTAVCFVLALFSALLIHAAFNNHRQLVMPWLWATMLITCTRDVYMLVRSLFFFINSAYNNWFGPFYVVVMVIQLILGIYFWWIVYSFYHEQEGIKNKQIKASLNKNSSNLTVEFG